MSSANELSEFPNVEAKLQKPSKQSAFEKQKAEAEAKRRREAAETAAVYEDFVKSFDDEDDDNNYDPRLSNPSRLSGSVGGRRSVHGPVATLGAGGTQKRHFGVSSGASGLKSGPGSLGPPPTYFGKKRPFDQFQQGSSRRDWDENRTILAQGHGLDGLHLAGGSTSVARAFTSSDDDAEDRATERAEEKALARPTLRLANLPLGTSPAVVKMLLPSSLTIEHVRILPPNGPSGTEKRSIAAIVTLSSGTPANEIDASVSSLQNKYLGHGFYLSLHRHLSSAVTTTLATPAANAATSYAFGAKPVTQTADPGHQHINQFQRSFAPPSSYNVNTGSSLPRLNLLHVPVHPPKDIKQVKLIHKVVESVLQHGPEFEALLMSRPDVQKDEKWAWIWDARSPGGRWYRWRLWEVITGYYSTDRHEKFLPLFEGSHAWKVPDRSLVYEYITTLDEFVSDPEYSSEDDDEEYEGRRQTEVGTVADESENTYLNPLDKSKLTHLLARLPTTLGTIRKGDIARVTTFAITHASRGSDEIVDMIVSNVERPFSLILANADHKSSYQSTGAQLPTAQHSTPAPQVKVDKTLDESLDTSAASLVGLYAVSDILSSSATSGVRHAWRYRQLFETALRERKTFEALGSMAEKFQWGRLRADKWKRSVGLVLNLWEGWCVFATDSQRFFATTFEDPPSAKKEELPDEAPKRGKWKTVEAPTAKQNGTDEGAFRSMQETDQGDCRLSSTGVIVDETDGEPIDDLEAEEYDDDIDGVPMDEEISREAVGTHRSKASLTPRDEADRIESTSRSDGSIAVDRLSHKATTTKPRKRLRAVDMFANSDESEGDK